MSDPVSPAHRVALARHAAGDLEGASVLLQAAWAEARANAPQTAAALASDLAVILFELGRPEIAESLLSAEIARDGDPRLLDTLAQVHFSSGRTSDAVEIWKRCLELGYDVASVHEGLRRAAGPTPAPRAGDAGPSRLVVPVANDVTCDRATLFGIVHALAAEAPLQAVFPWPDPLSRRLAASGVTVLTSTEREQVHHHEETGPLPRRFRFIEDRLAEDRFLNRLPMPGKSFVPTTSAVWDRWLFQLQSLDLRRFVARLPLAAGTEVEIIGGAATNGSLPGLVVAAARAAGLPVSGRVVGPVDGRFAPLWLPGCTRLRVGNESQAGALAELRLEIPIAVDPALAPASTRRPISWEGPARDVLVDIHRLSERGTLNHHLAQLAAARPEAIRRFVIKAPEDLREILHRVPGPSAGGVPIVLEAGSPVRAARSGKYRVISVAPYRLLHVGALPASIETGVIRSEVIAACGRIEDSLVRLIADAVPEGVA